MKKNHSIQPLAFRWYVLPVAFLVMVGLVDAAYLSLSHFRVYTDIGYKSFCAISKAINCDTVSQSPYSIFLGVPVPIWGLIGYLMFAALLIPAALDKWKRRHLWPLLFLMALVFSICSVVLAVISIYRIRSYCLLCMLSHAVNLLLLFYTWIIVRRFGRNGFFSEIKNSFRCLINQRRRVSVIVLVFSAGIVAAAFGIPNYWHVAPPPLPSDLPTGLTPDGHPWIGSPNPQVVIVEFTDYQCFQCRKMHFFLRQMIAENRGNVQLVHRHFPMDSKFNSVVVQAPFHEGSGKMALIAVYAALKGKFWPVNDLLFDAAAGERMLDLRAIGHAVDIDPDELVMALRHPSIRERLRLDIWEGMRLRIIGTPSYVIDGKVYQGNLPGHILKKIKG